MNPVMWENSNVHWLFWLSCLLSGSKSQIRQSCTDVASHPLSIHWHSWQSAIPVTMRQLVTVSWQWRMPMWPPGSSLLPRGIIKEATGWLLPHSVDQG